MSASAGFNGLKRIAQTGEMEGGGKWVTAAVDRSQNAFSPDHEGRIEIVHLTWHSEREEKRYDKRD